MDDDEPTIEEQVELALASLREEDRIAAIAAQADNGPVLDDNVTIYDDDINALPPAGGTKKYRAALYDVHDETYANTMRKIESDNGVFNVFTDNLMAEPRINRHSLLKAIDDYNDNPISKLSPLSELFVNEAFNCRPYQACIIC